MFRRLRTSLSLVTVVVLALATGATAAGHPGDQHGPGSGHLLGSGEWGKIDLVSSLRVSDAEEGLIADVAVDPDGDYAYLARWGGAECAGPEGNGPDGGVYVIDISDLSNPRQVGFIATQRTRPSPRCCWTSVTTSSGSAIL